MAVTLGRTWAWVVGGVENGSPFKSNAILAQRAQPTFKFYSLLFFPPDFDDDGTLDKVDLEKLVNCLTGEGEDCRLSPAEMEQLIENVKTKEGGGGATSGHQLVGLQHSCHFPAIFLYTTCFLQILEESDIDKDGTINLSEFQHIISRSPDFTR